MATRRADRGSKEPARTQGAEGEAGPSLDGSGARALRGKSKQELLAAAKALGLERVSKLKKDALVERVLSAMRERSAGSAAAPTPEPQREDAVNAASPPEPEGSAKQAEPPEAPRGEARTAAAEAREPGRTNEPDAEPDPAATAKLAIGPAAAAREKPAQIPWSYGADRLTASAIDPDRLFVYWEVTDPAIERARASLGAGGPGAWPCLRVYDTSGLIFDGTNARGYFDHAVDRGTRQWFFHVGKPTSTAFVELGMKSTEGYFVKIVRSGRVDFPRREPAPVADPEWMTVRPWSGEVADVHRGAAPRAGGGNGAPQPHRFDPAAYWNVRDPVAMHEVVLRHLLQWGWERVEWSEASGEGWFAMEGRMEWESPRVFTSWEAGPFAYPVEIQPPRREDWEGGGFAYRVGDVVHVVRGPWRVVIRNLGAHAERELLGSWEIHHSWSVLGGREVRIGPGRFGVRVGASEMLTLGASERRWLQGSEVRLGGASERWRIGASEIAFRGASEQLFTGASQAMLRGASERRYAGGSEFRLGGASERAFAGASESRLGGASERAFSGASEGRFGGASELRFEGGSALPLPYPPANRDDTEQEA